MLSARFAAVAFPCASDTWKYNKNSFWAWRIGATFKKLIDKDGKINAADLEAVALLQRLHPPSNASSAWHAEPTFKQSYAPQSGEIFGITR